MKFKVILILKSGFKYEIEYMRDDITNTKEVKNFFSESLESKDKAFIIQDDFRVDYYIKSEIAHLTIECVNSN